MTDLRETGPSGRSVLSSRLVRVGSPSPAGQVLLAAACGYGIGVNTAIGHVDTKLVGIVCNL